MITIYSDLKTIKLKRDSGVDSYIDLNTGALTQKPNDTREIAFKDLDYDTQLKIHSYLNKLLVD